MIGVMFRIFDKLGGEAAALKAIRGRRLRPDWPAKETVTDWKRKGEIAGAAVLEFMAICDERLIPYCSADFRAAEKVDA